MDDTVMVEAVTVEPVNVENVTRLLVRLDTVRLDTWPVVATRLLVVKAPPMAVEYDALAI